MFDLDLDVAALPTFEEAVAGVRIRPPVATTRQLVAHVAEIGVGVDTLWIAVFVLAAGTPSSVQKLPEHGHSSNFCANHPDVARDYCRVYSMQSKRAILK